MDNNHGYCQVVVNPLKLNKWKIVSGHCDNF